MLLLYNERERAPHRRRKWIGTITAGGANRLASAKFSPTLQLFSRSRSPNFYSLPNTSLWLSLARDAQWYFGN